MSDNQEFNESEFQDQMHAFFERADAVITLANSQLSPSSHAGQVAASLNYAAARFAISAATIGFIKGSDLAKEKDDIIKFYTEKYQQMLAENLEQYIENFDQYTQLAKNNPNPSL
ncbi:DUF3144 domain-containing protein [Moraxella catarrhalis]|uniref:DUF3144 domain-containing protein n=1 Tax=Moraxella catarrhalis TaxID=480 RepID=UPI000202A1C7|nr:DUF3144 domain-containing protein [Moraxella catarrhalis]AIK00319.1 hypothetical protein DR90_1278 [Moraxella catarrhalis]AIT43067.1 hypothetical protein MC25239_00638 [Moraxella catarrhalis]AVL50909.1 DUF3144 domain-containing protein [Moraxella catarrhalis]AXT93084.1 hypothetical protein SP69_02935 [Moraxella catarrhalis]AXT94684.1 hypothetical protein SQ00_02970 [Moraxella catarrhalis]